MRLTQPSAAENLSQGLVDQLCGQPQDPSIYLDSKTFESKEATEVLWEVLSRVVKLISNGLHALLVLICYEIDGYTLSSETSGPTNTVQICFCFSWNVIVYHQGNILDVNTTRNDVCGNKYARLARAKLSHDLIALSLIKLGVDAGDRVSSTF